MHWNYGPPIICNCATLYYSSHKTSTLFTKFHNDVMFKQWFIDDIFITWVGTPEIFAEFKSEIFWIAYCENNMVEAIPQFPWSYNLHYPWLKHCNKDLPKMIHLYLYIPASYVHPPGMIIGMVNSLGKVFTKSLIDSLQFLYIWVVARGCYLDWIKHLHVEAARRAQ